MFWNILTGFCSLPSRRTSVVFVIYLFILSAGWAVPAFSDPLIAGPHFCEDLGLQCRGLGDQTSQLFEFLQYMPPHTFLPEDFARSVEQCGPAQTCTQREDLGIHAIYFVPAQSLRVSGLTMGARLVYDCHQQFNLFLRADFSSSSQLQARSREFRAVVSALRTPVWRESLARITATANIGLYPSSPSYLSFDFNPAHPPRSIPAHLDVARRQGFSLASGNILIDSGRLFRLPVVFRNPTCPIERITSSIAMARASAPPTSPVDQVLAIFQQENDLRQRQSDICGSNVNWETADIHLRGICQHIFDRLRELGEWERTQMRSLSGVERGSVYRTLAIGNITSRDHLILTALVEENAGPDGNIDPGRTLTLTDDEVRALNARMRRRIEQHGLAHDDLRELLLNRSVQEALIAWGTSRESIVQLLGSRESH